MNRDRRRYQMDLAVRRPRNPQHAAERSHRGAQLCRDALAGVPVPEAPDQSMPGVRVEQVACSGCYTPILAPPGSRCRACTADQRT